MLVMFLVDEDDFLISQTGIKILDLGLASFKSNVSLQATAKTGSSLRSGRGGRTMRESMRTSCLNSAGKRTSFVEIDADDVHGFKAIRAPEMHPNPARGNIVRFSACR